MVEVKWTLLFGPLSAVVKRIPSEPFGIKLALITWQTYTRYGGWVKVRILVKLRIVASW